MDKIQTIDEIIVELDNIIEQSVSENNFFGVFAFVYRRTTEQIKAGILEGKFENPTRMENFDVTFAHLYIDAYHAYCEGMTPSRSWLACFNSGNRQLSILQHVIMGMNAHISLDLGIATAEVTRGKNIDDLKEDFNRVNEILNALIDEIQDRIGRASWLFRLMDFTWGKIDEKLIEAGIREFREHAWQVAVQLTNASSEKERLDLIERFDQKTADFNRSIQQPKNKMMQLIWWTIRLFEEKDIGKIIQNLRIDEPV